MTTKRILTAVLCVLLALVIIMFAIVLVRVSSLFRPQTNTPNSTTAPTGNSNTTDPAPDGSRPPEHEHSYVFVEEIKASCTGFGWKQYQCTLCEHTEMRDRVEPFGHELSTGDVVAPTCTEVGYTEKKCSRCGEVEHHDEVAALGHEYDEGTEMTATCGEDAHMAYHCTRDGCEEVKKEPIEGGDKATGEHTFGEWVPSEDGTVLVRTCEVCHAEETKPNDGTEPPVTEEMKIISNTSEDLLEGDISYKRYTVVIGTDSNPSTVTYVIEDYLNNGSLEFTYSQEEGLVLTLLDANGEIRRYVLTNTEVTVDQNGSLVG